ncbi:MAG: pyridoxamine 5'-phosphate oxidase family protein [Planctomycetota bacterium]
MSNIENIEQLEAIYGHPGEASTVKVTTSLTPDYQAFVDTSPFLALATSGPDGLDCSPRGDRSGVVRVVDEHTIHLPDRRGNNRVDSLRNILHDPRVALLFFLPGSGTTLRINGSASICVESSLLESFAVNGKLPRSVVVIKIHEVFFQCARAIVRSELWNPERFVDVSSIPTPGQILANLTEDRVGGEAYDREWPDRAKKSLW